MAGWFGPDPATRSVTTMGSVLAVDASGTHWPLYGSARDHVESLQIVLADGQVMEVGRHTLADDPAEQAQPQRQQLVRRLAELLVREQKVIRSTSPRAWSTAAATSWTTSWPRTAWTWPVCWSVPRARWRSSRKPPCGRCRVPSIAA